MTSDSHHHHHVSNSESSAVMEKRLWWAVGANMLLTVAQIVGGVVSGSLSLIADALHNFSDAASLLIALVAIRIGRKPKDECKTFGYQRAETVAALINLTTLIVIGLYLLFEAVKRFINPEAVEGWTIVIVAGIALLVDVFTALLTYLGSKESLNIKAAFLHNVADALASIGVIITGTLILCYGWIWTDAAMTLVIATYVLWQSLREMPKVIHILMEGAPAGIEIKDVIVAMEETTGVSDVHHVHIWRLDEDRNALEAHVLLEEGKDLDEVKEKLKRLLKEQYSIGHSTLEFELVKCHD